MLSQEKMVSPCLVNLQYFVGETVISSLGCMSGQWYIECVRCSDYMSRVLAVSTSSKWIQGIKPVDVLTGGIARTLSVTDSQLHLFFVFFLSGLTFSLIGYERKEEKGLNQGFLPLYMLPSWAIELRLPETAAFEVLVFNLRPFSGLEH